MALDGAREPSHARGDVRLVCLALLLLGACGGAPARPRTNVAPPSRPEEPLPTEANRNAPPPEPFEGGAEPSLPHVVLWCTQPAGSACLAAQQELGLVPTPTPEVPAILIDVPRDLDDDCADPDLVPIMQRVENAVGGSPGGWTDQSGPLDAMMLANLYAGPGCTNAARHADPPVKVHVAEVEGQPHLLVRVWELGEVDR